MPSRVDVPRQETKEGSSHKVRPSSERPRLIRRGSSPDARPDVQAEDVRANVEMRGAVRRGETESWTDARTVPCKAKSADSSLLECDGAEPETPRLPILFLADIPVVTRSQNLISTTSQTFPRARVSQHARPYSAQGCTLRFTAKDLAKAA